MLEDHNAFPYGKFDLGVGVDSGPTILAVLNGLQQNLMLVVQKLDILENKIKELESCSSDTQK
jgi:hypothetical protein